MGARLTEAAVAPLVQPRPAWRDYLPAAVAAGGARWQQQLRVLQRCRSWPELLLQCRTWSERCQLAPGRLPAEAALTRCHYCCCCCPRP